MLQATELRLGNWYESRRYIMCHNGEDSVVWIPQQVKHITAIGINPVEFKGHYVQRTECPEQHQIRGIELFPAMFSDRVNYSKNGHRFKEFLLDDKCLPKPEEFRQPSEHLLRFDQDGSVEYVINEFAGGHDGGCSITVKYLHQLQNAYWVAHDFLEELKINSLALVEAKKNLTTVVIRGKIEVVDWEDSNNGVKANGITISEHLEGLDKINVTIQLFISDEEKTKEELKDSQLLSLSGILNATYNHVYWDFGTYVSTDDKVTIGNYDLLDEIEKHKGKFLHLEVEIN